MNFDVPGWIATLAGRRREDIAYVSEAEQSGLLSVTYALDGGGLAKVDLVAMPMGDSGRATWQLFAQLGDRIERAQVPAKTRFVWR